MNPKWNAIITDMKMPKLTGQDVLEHVKRNFPHIPVLIMTAYGSIEAAVEAMKVGAFRLHHQNHFPTTSFCSP